MTCHRIKSSIRTPQISKAYFASFSHANMNLANYVQIDQSVSVGDYHSFYTLSIANWLSCLLSEGVSFVYGSRTCLIIILISFSL